jgi:ubiquinone biosynthesis protein Coq4
MFQFEQPDSTQTLQEGLNELNSYYAQGQNITKLVSEKAQFVLKAHDCIHVIFGCDISYQGEALNHAWTLWGTDSNLKQLQNLLGDEHHQLAKQYLNLDNAIGCITALPLILKVFFHSRQMHRRFPWLHYETFLQKPLHEIRQQFGIKLVAINH